MASLQTASTSLLQTHVDAFLLAVASSTDNFMVGITAGLSTQSLTHFYKVNLAVALCNACGTLVATYGGDGLKKLPERALMSLAAAVSTSSSPETYVLNFSPESFLATFAFGYLAWKEFRQNPGEFGGDDGDDKTKKQKKSESLSYSIALPMTLNNLAGGVAGGVMGLSVLQATFYAFIVSFGSMACGNFLASRILGTVHTNNNSPEQRTTTMLWCKRVAILIYCLLCFQSWLEI